MEKISSDCLFLVFLELSPGQLLRCALVSKFWNKVSKRSEIWERFGSMRWYEELRSVGGWQERWRKWLHDEIQDYYLTTGRLSYYNRDYKTNELKMKKSLLPTKIVCNGLFAGPLQSEESLMIQSIITKVFSDRLAKPFNGINPSSYLNPRTNSFCFDVNVRRFIQPGEERNSLKWRGQDIDSKLMSIVMTGLTWDPSIEKGYFNPSVDNRSDVVIWWISMKNSAENEHSINTFAKNDIKRSNKVLIVGYDMCEDAITLEGIVTRTRAFADSMKVVFIMVSTQLKYNLEEKQDYYVVDDVRNCSVHKFTSTLFEICAGDLPKKVVTIEELESFLLPSTIEKAKKNFENKKNARGNCGEETTTSWWKFW